MPQFDKLNGDKCILKVINMGRSWVGDGGKEVSCFKKSILVIKIQFKIY